MKLRIAHSPDADDYFLFWALRTNILRSDSFEFEFSAFDTEELNEAARTGAFDVIAISSATLPSVLDQYFVLASGASVGRNYGPKLITSAKTESPSARRRRLQEGTIGVPGNGTTAALLLKRYLPGAKTKFIPLTPFRGVFDRIRSGDVEAAVVIHEGQLTYSEFGCELVEDLGSWWCHSSGCPLPVGINVVHRRLGPAISELSSLLQESVKIALERKSEILPFLVEMDRNQGGKLRAETEIEHYLSLYANEDSYSLPAEAIRGLEDFLGLSLEGCVK